MRTINRELRALLASNYQSVHVILAFSFAIWVGSSSDVQAQLRIATWNTNVGSFGDYAPRQTFFHDVLEYMGLEPVNGFAKPLDVLILQEQESNNSSLQDFADELNAITGTTDYVPWSESPTANGLQTGFVYNSATVQSIHEDWRDTGLRNTSRIQLRPVGYGSSADIWIYNTHYSANTTQTDLIQRREEAELIRQTSLQGQKAGIGNSGVAFGSDFLPADANIIYAGDFNQLSGTEEPTGNAELYFENPYQIMQAGPNDSDDFGAFAEFEIFHDPNGVILWEGVFGNGEAIDVMLDPNDDDGIIAGVNWASNATFAHLHTQSPWDAVPIPGHPALVSGGMDNRFDFQLPSTDLNDGEGVDYIGLTNPDPNNLATEHSHRVFGNNGTSFNVASNSVGNTGLNWIINELGQSSTIRDQIRNSTAKHDHLPLVLDYQLPSVLDADISSVPANVAVGATEEVMVTVENIADVLAAVGADELDYTITVTGDLIGSFSGTDWALGGGITHGVTLDTSTPGAKTGEIVVETTSQGSPVTMLTFPINFTVGSGVLGDFNNDGNVDGLDFLEWQLGNSPVALSAQDLSDWETNYGFVSSTAVVASVPEPSSLALLLLVPLGLVRCRSRS